MRTLRLLLTAIQMVWALPNTLLGCAVGTAGLLTGGRVRRVGNVIEFYGGGTSWLLQRLPNGEFTLALTLGHTILGATSAALDISRNHELVHVRQYERWGPFFLPAYGISSLWMWCTGRRAYRDNHFEREAYDHDDCTGGNSTACGS
jgi:hypothetical protein